MKSSGAIYILIRVTEMGAAIDTELPRAIPNADQY